ncbi:MAG: AraC family transcriptional regulator [Cyclobacteriaceae bacterium]|nr:AraC family transcriptional regulator [Cyclobacteriaceae bacterium]
MLRNIHIYELPKGEENIAFHVYEVKGKTIQNKEYPHKTEQPHRHSYYEICIFINGAGQHMIDFKSFPINSGSIHFLTPGQVHLISREEDYHGFLLVFSREFYSLGSQDEDLLMTLPFFNNNTTEPILNLSHEEFAEVLDIIDHLRRDYKRDSEIREDVLRSYLHILLLKCRYFFNRNYFDRQTMNDPTFMKVNNFRKLVEMHFRELHLVKDYADKLNESPAHLNKIVKGITGENAGEFIIKRIVLEAKRLLIYTDLSNKEISFKMNYDDPSYFSRLFRKKVGMSPSDFKMQMKKKYQQ